MDAFSHLSVLLSIIIGLAMTQVLQGYRGLLLARARVRLYAPTLIWSAMLLLQTSLLYMIAALIFPDIPADANVDLRAHYYRERKPLYGILIAMLGASILKDWAIDGHLPEAENLAFHAVFTLAGIGGVLTANRRFHEIVTPLMAGVIALYIGLLFSTLA